MTDFVADTHALIWYLEDSPRLSVAAKSAFNDRYVFLTRFLLQLVGNWGKLRKKINALYSRPQFTSKMSIGRTVNRSGKTRSHENG